MAKCRLTFHTTKGQSYMFQITKTKNMALLSLDTCIKLGLLSINDNVHLVDNADTTKDFNKILEQYSDVFK